MTGAPFLRLAEAADAPALRSLIHLSARVLQAGYYSPAQTESALDCIFAVDPQLIADRSYFIVEKNGTLVACGGWSFRQTLCGGENAGLLRENGILDPATEAARIRAFFVHPAHARQGLGSLLLQACEKALQSAGFRRAQILATLAGEALYVRHGYAVQDRYELDLADGGKLPVLSLGKSFAAPS